MHEVDNNSKCWRYDSLYKKVSGILSGPIVALATFITDASCHATHVSPFTLVINRLNLLAVHNVIMRYHDDEGCVCVHNISNKLTAVVLLAKIYSHLKTYFSSSSYTELNRN